MSRYDNLSKALQNAIHFENGDTTKCVVRKKIAGVRPDYSKAPRVTNENNALSQEQQQILPVSREGEYRSL